jgi:hypothetical protein
MKKHISILVLVITPISIWGQKYSPGKERWQGKTCITHFDPPKEGSLNELLHLRPVRNYSYNLISKIEGQRFPDSIGRHHFRKGDMITISGFILLVAIEKNRKGGIPYSTKSHPFFDAYLMNTLPRGKQNDITHEKMKSYTCWEIHPIIAINIIGFSS